MIGWRILCGGLVFVAVSTVAGAGLAVLAGKLTPLPAWMAMAAGLICGILAAGGCMAPMVWWQSCVTASRSLEAMGVSPPGLCDSSGGAVQLSRISSSASCCSSIPATTPTNRARS
jgi:hypothetical protein